MALGIFGLSVVVSLMVQAVGRIVWFVIPVNPYSQEATNVVIVYRVPNVKLSVSEADNGNMKLKINPPDVFSPDGPSPWMSIDYIKNRFHPLRER